MEMETDNGNLPILDIHQAAFLQLHGITPNLTMQGTKVIFEFPGTKTVYNLIRAYNENPAVNVLDFVSHLRRLRGQMLSRRGL
jgi:hypothetical protein